MSSCYLQNIFNFTVTDGNYLKQNAAKPEHLASLSNTRGQKIYLQAYIQDPLQIITNIIAS